MQALNVLKYLSNPSTGCNRRVLLPLYKSLVRSILDYGAPVYELTPKSQLSILDPIQNAALRISTGAFGTSPAPSLYADAGIPPLNYGHLTLASNLLCSVLQLSDSSVHQAIFETPCYRATYRGAFTQIKNFVCTSLSRKIVYHCLPPRW